MATSTVMCKIDAYASIFRLGVHCGNYANFWNFRATGTHF